METIQVNTPLIVENDHSDSFNTTESSVKIPPHILGLSYSQFEMLQGQYQKLFMSKSLPDTRDINFQEDLVSFVQSNPSIDFVYRFDLPKLTDDSLVLLKGHTCLSALSEDTGKDIFIAGSSVLHYLVRYHKSYVINWKSNDTDIFYLNCIKNTRMEGYIQGIDMIFCKDKTIESVLLNFDLPCCRTAVDFHYNFYVSAQALASVFTGKMYLPKYFENIRNFTEVLNQFPTSEGFSNNIRNTVQSQIIKRFYERIQKYQSRGFKAIFVKEDYILPWLKNRFTYIDFTDINQ